MQTAVLDPETDQETETTSRPVSPDRLSTLLGRGRYKPIARAAGMDSRNVSRILRGLYPCVQMATANRIAMAAGVTMDELQAYIEMKRIENEKNST